MLDPVQTTGTASAHFFTCTLSTSVILTTQKSLFRKCSLSNNTSAHTRKTRKHKQTARLAGREARQPPAHGSGLGSALGTTAEAPAGAAGKRSRPGQAQGHGAGDRAGCPAPEQRAAEGAAAGPGKGRECLRGPPQDGRAASHQQRQAEEAPSRQQVRRSRRHLRCRQRARGRPPPRRRLKRGGLASPRQPPHAE